MTSINRYVVESPALLSPLVVKRQTDVKNLTDSILPSDPPAGGSSEDDTRPLFQVNVLACMSWLVEREAEVGSFALSETRLRGTGSKEFCFEVLVATTGLRHALTEAGLIPQAIEQRVSHKVGIAEEAIINGATKHPQGGGSVGEHSVDLCNLVEQFPIGHSPLVDPDFGLTKKFKTTRPPLSHSVAQRFADLRRKEGRIQFIRPVQVSGRLLPFLFVILRESSIKKD